MSFLPSEKNQGGINGSLAPMIDFLFLMLSFFACLAVSRITTRDTDIQLVTIKPEASAIDSTRAESEIRLIYIGITDKNEFKWVTEVRDYAMQSAQEIAEELLKQHEQGLIPDDKSKTQILLRIDKQASWEKIVELLFAIREAGFDVRPLYEPSDSQ